MEDTYTLMRHFADSWFLIFMFSFFIGACLFVFRRGSGAIHKDTAGIPFRYEDRPADDLEPEDRA
jgi:cytochrome c oxidase cbb3-type subunit 4